MKHKRTLITVSVFLGLAGLGVLIALQTGETVPFKSSSLSRSLIGHGAVVELLRRNDFQVTINHRTQPVRSESEGLVVFAPTPPEEREHAPVRWHRLTDRFRPQLVVLPKWEGLRHMKKKHWIHITDRFDNSVIEQVLKKENKWTVGYESASDDEGESAGNTYSIQSATGRSHSVRAKGLQFFQSVEGARILWRVDDRPVVVRESQSDRVWVSDPDLLSNMFLGKAQNAEFAVSLFQKVFPKRQFIVDERFRGFGISESLLELLFTFPGLILTLNVTFLMLCFYWWLYNHWSGRHRDDPTKRSRLEQADAMGRLTHAHGEHAHAGRLYVSNGRALTADLLNLPEDTSWSRIVKRLDSLRPDLADRLRAIEDDLIRLNELDPDQERILNVARQVKRVYEQLRHGVREGAEGSTSNEN